MANENQQVALLILKALNFGFYGLDYLSIIIILKTINVHLQWIGFFIHNYCFKNDQRVYKNAKLFHA